MTPTLPPSGPPPDGSTGGTGRFVFGHLSAEFEAARCTLAAVLVQQDRLADVQRFRYSHSVEVSVDAPQTAFVHYFRTPDDPDARALFPVRTVHTPGVDDLGGLVPPAR